MRADCALNIILIGMPGAGKSTVGVLLAKRLGYHFIDTDLLIQARERSRLQNIIGHIGLTAFKVLEEDVLCSLQATHSVVATGGSAVYSERAMAHLRSLGQLVFIDVPLAELTDRVRDMDTRGLVIGPGESFATLFDERHPLYRRFAEVTINAEDMRVDEVAAAIERRVCGPDRIP